MKKCSRCKKEKEHWEFNLCKSSASGLSSWCRSCQKKNYRKYQYWLKHGITHLQYDLMAKAQNKLCIICGQPEVLENSVSGKILSLAVDHCHKTGKIRGLLCTNCNLMLGKAKDSPEILRKAAEYLEKTNNK